METDAIFDADNNYEDPQMCATLACDIYKHLRVAEVTLTYFMNNVLIFYSSYISFLGFFIEIFWQVVSAVMINLLFIELFLQS